MEEHILHGDLDDILFCLGASLRYALGRQTYATSLVPEVLISNLDAFDQKWLINGLRDIDDYIENRKRWNNCETYTTKYDDICDYSSWLNLKQKLIDEYHKRAFNESLIHYDIWQTVLDIYHIHDAKRTYIGNASTIEDASFVIVDYLIESGCEQPFIYTKLEDRGIVKYDVTSHTKCFEVELKDKSKSEGEHNEQQQ